MRILAIIFVALLVSCQDSIEVSQEGGGVSVAAVLRTTPHEGFETIDGPPKLSFPRDHGPHRKQQIEWWYYTGNLQAETGEEFGFQLTFFRIGITPEDVERGSAWSAQESYMAHFALTDINAAKFYSFERLSRGGLGLAGIKADPFHVWTESWFAKADGKDTFPMRLSATENSAALDLMLNPSKPMTLQGDRGYSRKGKEKGNASGYISFTRLAATGTVNVGGRAFEVTGDAWMDHEWSTSVLDEGLVGWDWFSIHLQDGRDLMLYQLRGEDGSASKFSSGALIEKDGTKTYLKLDEFSITVLERWTSPRSKNQYPSRWTLEVPSKNLKLNVVPATPDQELDVSVHYWEGAVRVTGSANGRGYTELVGYGKNEQ